MFNNINEKSPRPGTQEWEAETRAAQDSTRTVELSRRALPLKGAVSRVGKLEKRLQVVTVGRAGNRMAATGRGFSVPVWAIKMYEAKPRKKDGVYTYRLSLSWGHVSGKKPSARLLTEAVDYATELGVPFVNHVAHGDVLTSFPLEILALSALGEEE